MRAAAFGEEEDGADGSKHRRKLPQGSTLLVDDLILFHIYRTNGSNGELPLGEHGPKR